MSRTLDVGIIGAGWPGLAHARGYMAAGGFRVVAVADLIPERRQQLANEFKAEKVFEAADSVLKDGSLDVVSICTPTHLHAEMAARAMRFGKHVMIESPPAPDVAGARAVERAAEKYKKIVMYALQRRFGPGEMAAQQAIGRGFIGDVLHIRASWMRSRGIPVGTGWYAEAEKSGGGAMMDLGLHMLDLAWGMMGQPMLEECFATTHGNSGVEEIAHALLRFANGKTLELSAAWSVNQPPSQNGTILRINGTAGAMDVYTQHGAVVYTKPNEKGEMKQAPLPPPKVTHHAAMMRQFKTAITTGSQPTLGAAHGVALMKMMHAIYRSAKVNHQSAISNSVVQ